MSAESKLDRLNQLTEKLKEDLDRERIKVSDASKAYVANWAPPLSAFKCANTTRCPVLFRYIDFTKKTPDPLIHDGNVDQSQNPFSKATKGGGGCIIL